MTHRQGSLEIAQTTVEAYHCNCDINVFTLVFYGSKLNKILATKFILFELINNKTCFEYTPFRRFDFGLSVKLAICLFTSPSVSGSSSWPSVSEYIYNMAMSTENLAEAGFEPVTSR